ncbi:hypothetical protein N644_2181 [Lactiplantibacillus paraplantarum]|nr:hypothetical protein N644_2181 [Lactiplantibacillus paraplantarum]
MFSAIGSHGYGLVGRASLLFLNSSLILQPTRNIGNFIKKFR